MCQLAAEALKQPAYFFAQELSSWVEASRQKIAEVDVPRWRAICLRMGSCIWPRAPFSRVRLPPDGNNSSKTYKSLGASSAIAPKMLWRQDRWQPCLDVTNAMVQVDVHGDRTLLFK